MKKKSFILGASAVVISNLNLCHRITLQSSISYCLLSYQTATLYILLFVHKTNCDIDLLLFVYDLE